MLMIPDYARCLGRANRNICGDLLAKNFDGAMAIVCDKKRDIQLGYHMESTHPLDQVYIESNHIVHVLNATAGDGELWHGLLVDNEEWANGVESICVSIYGRRKTRELLWKQNFKGLSIAKRTRQRNDLVMFQPFKHPLPLMDLDITVVTKIVFKPGVDFEASQVFGIASNGFCEWLQRGKFEIKLCKKNVARVNMRDCTITIK